MPLHDLMWDYMKRTTEVVWQHDQRFLRQYRVDREPLDAPDDVILALHGRVVRNIQSILGMNICAHQTNRLGSKCKGGFT